MTPTPLNTCNVVPLKVPLPYVLYRWFDVPVNHPNRAEILLFRTVILDAFYDLAKKCSKAEAWLLTPSADLAEVATVGRFSVFSASPARLEGCL